MKAHKSIVRTEADLLGYKCENLGKCACYNSSTRHCDLCDPSRLGALTAKKLHAHFSAIHWNHKVQYKGEQISLYYCLIKSYIKRFIYHINILLFLINICYRCIHSSLQLELWGRESLPLPALSIGTFKTVSNQAASRIMYEHSWELTGWILYTTE